jgi:hypothetical protein
MKFRDELINLSHVISISKTTNISLLIGKNQYNIKFNYRPTISAILMMGRGSTSNENECILYKYENLSSCADDFKKICDKIITNNDNNE